MKKMNANEIRELAERAVFIFPLQNVLEKEKNKRYTFRYICCDSNDLIFNTEK